MKILPKLVLAFLAIAFLVGVVGYLSFNNLESVGTSFDKVQHETTPTIMALSAMKSSSLFLMAEANEIAVEPSPEHLEAFQEAKEELIKACKTYEQLEMAAGGDASAKKQAVEEMTEMAEEMIRLKQAGASTEVLHETAEEFNEKAEEFSRMIDLEINNHNEALTASQLSVSQKIQNASQMNLVFTLIALSLAIGMGVFIARSLYRPLMKLKHSANEITRSNLDTEVIPSSADEIGELASQFEMMRRSVKETNTNLNELVAMRTNQLEKLNEELQNANKELVRKDKLKDEFINIASHELRTPIQPIMAFVDLAKRGHVKHEDALDSIYRNATRLQQLATDILDVSKIETGQLTYSMRNTSINDLVSSVVNTLKVNCTDGVTLMTRFDRDVQFSADRSRITQALTNILSNCIKFTKKGAIKVETNLLVEKNKIEIRISDTGGGIPEDILPNLFHKFVTKDASETQHGTGLGLFISKAIVTAHKGEISAYNNGEGGATFVIVLPVSNIELQLKSSAPSK
jgi:signal transduction histidine kinase